MDPPRRLEQDDSNINRREGQQRPLLRVFKSQIQFERVQRIANKLGIDISDENNCFLTVLKALRERNWQLLKGCDREDLLQIESIYQRTLLMQLAAEGDECAHILLNWNKDKKHLIHADADGFTALHLAAMRGGCDLLRSLIKNCEIDTPRNNKTQETPLHTAIRHGQEGCVRLLLDEGASCLLQYRYDHENYKHPISLNAIELAVVFNQVSCLKILLDLLIKIQGEKLPIQNNPLIGNLLHLAILFKATSVLKYLFNFYPKLAHELLNQKNGNDETPLLFAAILGEGDSVYYLWQQGASFKATIRGDILKVTDAMKQMDYTILELLSYLGEPSKNITENFGISVAYKGLNSPARMPLHSPPESLVINGSSAHESAYRGLVDALSNADALRGIRRLAGSCWGAILATLFAVGYSAQEVKYILSTTAFIQFADFEIMDLETAKTRFNQLRSNQDKLHSFPGLCQGIALRDWIEERIYEKTRIRHLTFEELNHLVNKQYSHFKHLYFILFKYQASEQSNFGPRALSIPKTDKLETFRSENTKSFNLDAVICDVVASAVALSGFVSPLLIRRKRNNQIQLVDKCLYFARTFQSNLFLAVQNITPAVQDQHTLVVNVVAKGKQNEPNQNDFNEMLEFIIDSSIRSPYEQKREVADNSGNIQCVDIHLNQSPLLPTQKEMSQCIEEGYKNTQKILSQYHLPSNQPFSNLSSKLRGIVFPKHYLPLPFKVDEFVYRQDQLRAIQEAIYTKILFS